MKVYGSIVIIALQFSSCGAKRVKLQGLRKCFLLLSLLSRFVSMSRCLLHEPHLKDCPETSGRTTSTILEKNDCLAG